MYNNNDLNQNNFNIPNNNINNQPLQNNNFNQSQIDNTMNSNSQFVQNNNVNNQNNMSEKPKNNKKILLIVLLIAIVLAIIIITVVILSNRGNNNDINNNLSDNNSQITDNNQENSDKKFYEEWGYSDSFSTDDGVTFASYYINFPNFIGSRVRRGIIAEQLDGTVVLISGQNAESPVVDNLSDILPSYLDQIKKSLQDCYGVSSGNYNITIDNSKAVTVGDYAMYTHKGIITYDYNDSKRTHQYVAYATKLKQNGAYAYWMVYDFSEDQSKGDLITEHAYNMARTFREEE